MGWTWTGMVAADTLVDHRIFTDVLNAKSYIITNHCPANNVDDAAYCSGDNTTNYSNNSSQNSYSSGNSSVRSNRSNRSNDSDLSTYYRSD